mmetsp:Transcript_22549/g.62912  ORF Transcript_22549/g.62912 Transcript_22549/m.62912 type:complete len:310 (-) Transcript_22549:38-967(-)
MQGVRCRDVGPLLLQYVLQLQIQIGDGILCIGGTREEGDVAAGVHADDLLGFGVDDGQGAEVVQAHEFEGLGQGLGRSHGDEVVVVGADSQIVDGVIEETAVFPEVRDQVLQDVGVCDAGKDAHVFRHDDGQEIHLLFVQELACLLEGGAAVGGPESEVGPHGLSDGCILEDVSNRSCRQRRNVGIGGLAMSEDIQEVSDLEQAHELTERWIPQRCCLHVVLHKGVKCQLDGYACVEDDDLAARPQDGVAVVAVEEGGDGIASCLTQDCLLVDQIGGAHGKSIDVCGRSSHIGHQLLLLHLQRIGGVLY